MQKFGGGVKTLDNLLTVVGRILRWPPRYLPPGIRTLLTLLSLSVGKISEYNGVITLLISLHDKGKETFHW